MVEMAQKAVEVEIDKHPSMRGDILLEFDRMVESIEGGVDSGKAYANFIQYLDNCVRNQA